MDIIKQVIDECIKQDISQAELSKRMELEPHIISGYFHRHHAPSLKNLEKMADALGMELRLVKKEREK